MRWPGAGSAQLIASGDSLVTVSSTTDNPSGKTVPNRFADPDYASGVSVAKNEETVSVRTQPIINKNPLPGGKAQDGSISTYGGGRPAAAGQSRAG